MSLERLALQLAQPPAWFKAYAEPVCAALGVPVLTNYAHIALVSCLVFFASQAVSALLSPRLFPDEFKGFSRKTRLDWDLHFTGWFHALICTPLTLYILFRPSAAVAVDPLFASAPAESLVFAISGGYFAYDLLISLWLVRSHGLPFVIHALACCYIFFNAFTPFLLGVGSTFLVWELSTIFLHPHWWLDKLNRTGSTFQLVNGVLLLLSFFGTRVAFGGYQTIYLWKLLDDPRVGPKFRWGFRAANVALNLLQWSWFRLMIISVLKRFSAAKKGGGDIGATEGGKGKKDL